MFAMEDDDSSDDDVSGGDAVERPRMLSQGTEERAHMTNEMAGTNNFLIFFLVLFFPQRKTRGSAIDIFCFV